MKDMIRNNKDNFLELKALSLQRSHQVPTTTNEQSHPQRKFTGKFRPLHLEYRH